MYDGMKANGDGGQDNGRQGFRAEHGGFARLMDGLFTEGLNILCKWSFIIFFAKKRQFVLIQQNHGIVLGEGTFQ